ncbi:MAG: aminoacyl-tRNA hydrolase [Planctomycetes bacterium]|nr:aminoacyl-tRNA hydrolase [Planctomycetota bacterium]
MKIVVGLGNPGSQYEKTRHNVGFLVLAELAKRFFGETTRRKFDAEFVELFIAGEKTLLVAPMTFMNDSGRPVSQYVSFYNLPAEDLLVVCDDMNLETGRLRLRAGGSAGGQNGLKDIIRRLGTEEFPRLRIGIGRPPGRMSGSDYVLGRFTKDQTEIVQDAVPNAADGVESWIANGIESAMNSVNAPKDG